MRYELKDFRINSARAILDELDEARIAASKGKLQAVVLSAPTGSGKTITVAAVIDWTFGGADGIAARPIAPSFGFPTHRNLISKARANCLLLAITCRFTGW